MSLSAQLIYSLLGKNIESLECKDLLEKLKVISESPYVELKGRPESPEKSEAWRQLRHAILKSIVGFLNSSGEGLLVVGYDERDRKPTPIPPEAMGLSGRASKQDIENKLRDTVISSVKSIPWFELPSFPLLTVKVWSAEECGLQEHGYIALIYVAKRFDALYYYDEYRTYIREGSRTRPLSLEEAFRMVEAKSRPILMLLTTKPIPQPDGNIKIGFILKNLGSSPSFSRAIVVKIPKDPWMPRVIRGYILKDRPDILVLQHLSHAPLGTPSFPGADLQIPLCISVSISMKDSKDSRLQIVAEIYSESTWSYETLELNFGEVCQEHVKLEVRDYKTRSIIYQGLQTVECPEPLET